MKKVSPHQKTDVRGTSDDPLDSDSKTLFKPKEFDNAEFAFYFEQKTF